MQDRRSEVRENGENATAGGATCVGDGQYTGNRTGVKYFTVSWPWMTQVATPERKQCSVQTGAGAPSTTGVPRFPAAFKPGSCAWQHIPSDVVSGRKTEGEETARGSARRHEEYAIETECTRVAMLNISVAA